MINKITWGLVNTIGTLVIMDYSATLASRFKYGYYDYKAQNEADKEKYYFQNRYT